MADVMPIQTYEYKLNDIDIVNGQLIVCMDTGSMYRDSADNHNPTLNVGFAKRPHRGHNTSGA